MKDELLYEENIQDTDTDIQSDIETDIDVPTSKYQETDIYNQEEITRDILSALEEEGYIKKTENETDQEETRSAEEHGEYYDVLIQINSHLEYIEEHLYEPEEPKTIETPLNEYGLTEILLVGVLVVLGLSFVFNVIKDNVIHIR